MVLDGVRVDITDLVQKFIMGTLIVDRDENESPINKKTRSRKGDGDSLLSNVAKLHDHVKFCMRSFSTYIMISELESTDIITKKVTDTKKLLRL